MDPCQISSHDKSVVAFPVVTMYVARYWDETKRGTKFALTVLVQGCIYIWGGGGEKVGGGRVAMYGMI